MASIINASTSAGLQFTGDTSGNLVLQNNGTNALVVNTSGTVTLPNGTGTAAVQGVSTNIVSGTAQASTSGTAITFTGIPSWAKRITVLFNGVSTSGTSITQFQLGSTTITTTGYNGYASYGGAGGNQSLSLTTGIPASTSGIYSSSSVTLFGGVVFTNITSNTWIATGNIGGGSAGTVAAISGSISLSGALDRINITTVNGTDTFDAGSINIMWE